VGKDAFVFNEGTRIMGLHGRPNIIPETSASDFGLRLLVEDPMERRAVLRLIRDLASEAGMDGLVGRTLELKGHLEPVVNDWEMAALTRGLLAAAGFKRGERRVVLAGDDFAYLGAPPSEGGLGVPSMYAFAGLKDTPGWTNANLHDKDFRAPKEATGLVARALVPLYFAAVQRLAERD